MGVLGSGGAAGLPGALIGTDILFPVGPRNIFLGSGHSLVRNSQTVGTHVGNQTHGAVTGDVHAFVEGLGGPHGAGGGEAQPPGGLLLEGTGDKGGGGLFGPLAPLELAHGIAGAVQAFFDGPGLGLVVGQQFFARCVRGQPGRELFPAGRESGIHVPVFLGDKGLDFLFPVVDQPDRHALNPACRQAPANLSPQEGAQLIAHQTIQDPAGLLGVEQILVDGPGMGHPLLDPLLGDLVKGDPVGLLGVDAQEVGQVPADGLALPVRVGGQEDAVGLFGLGFELLDEFLLALDVDVLGRIAVLHINAELGGGQVPDVAHAGRHLVILAQIFADGFRLGRRFHNNQFRHSFSYLDLPLSWVGGTRGVLAILYPDG